MNIEQIYSKGDVRARRESAQAADRLHNTQRALNLRKKKREKGGGEKKGVVVNKREKLACSG